tara:strand:+ start:152 stop:403 length:252 start_codon:yes stop_codon:yes gene_type:complete
MNYSKLMSLNPCKYGEIVNNQKQLIEFYEHPIFGQDEPVIAVCHELGIAKSTDFFELDDMVASHGEYTPMFIDGNIVYGYQLM